MDFQMQELDFPEQVCAVLQTCKEILANIQQ